MLIQLKRVNVVREFNFHLASQWHVFLLILSVLSQASAETILIDDFNDGNDDGWTHVDLIAEGVNGPAIYDVSSLDYRISSTGSIPDVEDPNTPNFIGSSWDASSDSIFSNGFIRTNFRITGGGTAFGLMMRITGEDSPDFDDVAYYTFGATAFSGEGGQPKDGAVHFNRIEDNRTTKNIVLETRSDLFDRDWIMEAGVVGDKLSMRYWPVGEVEPTQPQWEWTDPNPLDAGILALRTNIDGTGIRLTGAQGPFRIGAIFDDISFIPQIGIEGDFNANGMLDSNDLDTLTGKILINSEYSLYDLNSDDRVDSNDRSFWITDLKETFLGDADLNQEVAFSDFLSLSGNFGDVGGWAEGDFDGNGRVQFLDFLILSSNFGKSATAATAVPEPSAATLLVAGLVCLLRRRRS